MHIGRTLPPASAPLTSKDILNGFKGLTEKQVARDRFRDSICRHFRVRHCFLVSSGAAALTIMLRAAAKLNPSRDLVLIPAYTCYSVPSAIKRARLAICPCDIDPQTLDFDPEKLAAAVREHKARLLAVVPTHLFGIPADVARLKRHIGREDIYVFEDAAQAMGGQGQDTHLGCSGDAGFFSLGRGKALSTMGGGIIVTDHGRLAGKIAGQIARCAEPGLPRILRTMAVTLFVHFFSRPSLFWLPRSMPFLRLGQTIYDPHFQMRRLSSFQAGLAIDWETRLAAAQSTRKTTAQYWAQALQRAGLANGLTFPRGAPGLVRYPVCVNDRNIRQRLVTHGNRRGLGIMLAYPDAVTHIPQLRTELAAYATPNARQVAGCLATLPTHAWLTDADKRRIEDAIRRTVAPFFS